MTTLITRIAILEIELGKHGHLGEYNNQEELLQHNLNYANKKYKFRNLNKNWLQFKMIQIITKKQIIVLLYK
jgi:hypothetical protein